MAYLIAYNLTILGENQGYVIFSVLQEFGLSKKVGYLTPDNASNNDTALQFLCKRLQEQGILFDPLEHRLHCIGHIINLVVKAFWYGNDIESVCGHNKEEVEGLLPWRTRGPYGRLRNIITYTYLLDTPTTRRVCTFVTRSLC